MGTKGGVGKGTFVTFASQLIAAGGSNVAVIDLDLTASGTTLAAESYFGAAKPDSVSTAFDHVARRASNISPYATGDSYALWDITPSFLERINGGRIWLLPARDPANTGQSFDVVANVLPPEQREAKLAAIVQEQLDRIRVQQPTVKAILVDCGAERNPIYGAAFSKADAGYILMGPHPEYFGEVTAVRDELVRMFDSIKLSRVYVVANQMTSISDTKRCQTGIAPLTLNGQIGSDPQLRRARDEGNAADLDLGHHILAAEIRACLMKPIQEWQLPLIKEDHLVYLPILTLIARGNGMSALTLELRSRRKLVWVLGIAGISLGGFATLWLFLFESGTGEGTQSSEWLIGSLILGLLCLAGAGWLWRVIRRNRTLLRKLRTLESKSPPEQLSDVVEHMADVERRAPGLTRKILRRVEGEKDAERQKR